jgi:Carboxypeptidase regulatory-like domain/TonB dependent receptor
MRYWLLGYVAAFLLLSGMGLATGATGALVGNVTDASGAVIAGAAVSATNRATGISRSTVSSGAGDYDIVILQPGSYQVTISKPGFKPLTFQNIDVDVDQIVRVDAQLPVEAKTEQVEVTDEVPLLESENTTVGAVVERKSISGLPLNERNFLNFTLLVPGAQLPVAGSNVSVQGGSVIVNGARETANTFLIDGVDNNSPLIGRSTLLPSVDAIEEFKVQASTSSAEYGRGGGAQINLLLRSGNNQLHGSAFEYLRNRALDAKNFFDLPDCQTDSVLGTCASIPKYIRNQFGGTLGGPIIRNRTFFFASYEGLQLRQATTRESTVPSQNLRGAILGSLPPDDLNPAGVAALNLYPAANVGSDLANSTLFVAAPVIRSTTHLGTIKVDHQLSSRDSLSAHYGISDLARYNPFDFGFSVSNLPGYGDNALYRGQNAGVNWVRGFSPRVTNEFRVGFNHDRLGLFQQNQGIDRNGQLGFPSPANPQDFGFPILQVAGYENIGEPFQAPEDNRISTLHLSDNLAWSPDFAGSRHHFRFGGEYRRIGDNGFIDFYPRGDFIFLGVTGNSVEDLVLGLPAAALLGSGNSSVHLRTNQFGLYGLDDFHLSSRLTLNLGLRWEYNQAPYDAKTPLSVADLSANSLTCTPKPNCQYVLAGSNGISRGIFNTGKNDFAPRIGLAWRPLKTDKMVVRSAYGVFWDAATLLPSSLTKENPPSYKFDFFLNSGANVIQNILQSPSNFIISFRPASSYHDAYLQQWNTGVQYQFTPQLVLETVYVGSKGAHLKGFHDANQSEPGGLPPHPQFGSLATIDTSRASTYHSLQTRLEQRPWRGLSYTLAYTWSKSIDNSSELLGSATEGQYAQEGNNLRGERGLSGFNTRHRLVWSGVYDVPLANGVRSRAARALLHSWQLGTILSLQSGQPFTIYRSGYQSFTTLITGTDRPDLIADPFRAGAVDANPDPACHSTIAQGGRAADRTRTVQTWINPCAYSNPNLLGQFRFGTSPRNGVIGPRLVDLDLSISRNLALFRESQRLSFRADVFNLFNHPNFDPPENIFDSQNFGSLPSSNRFGTRPPRQIQLALRYSF